MRPFTGFPSLLLPLLFTWVSAALATDEPSLEKIVVEVRRDGPIRDAAIEKLKRRVLQEGSAEALVLLQAPPRASSVPTETEDEEYRSLVRDLQDRFFSRHLLEGVYDRREHRLINFPIVRVVLTPENVDALVSDDQIASIETDSFGRLALADTIPQIGAVSAHLQGATGSGWSIAVLDTGVRKTAPGLNSKVIGEGCFSTSYQGSTLCRNGALYGSNQPGSGEDSNHPSMQFPDLEDHGTMVAGVAVSSSTLGVGVAPSASIVSMFVMSTINVEGSERRVIREYDAAAALDRVYGMRTSHSISSVNMSFVFGLLALSDFHYGTCDASFPAVAQAVATLTSVGIAVVAASGNSGAGYSSVDQLPGPACISDVVAVASVRKSDDQFANYSSINPKLELLAPGGHYQGVSTSAHQIYLPGFTQYKLARGTSLAAPHVAGAFALLKQKSPHASVADLLDQLQTTGVPKISDSGGSLVLTIPRIDVEAAAATPSIPNTHQVVREYCYGQNASQWSAAAGPVSHYVLEGSSSPSFTNATVLYSGAHTSAIYNVSGTTYMRVRACNGVVCSNNRPGSNVATYTPGCA